MRGSFYGALSTGYFKEYVQKIQLVLILCKVVVEFEKNVKLGYFLSPFFLSGYIHPEARAKATSIKFGEDIHINNNFVAIAEYTTLIIGKRCFIGTNVEIYDSDFHGIKVSIEAHQILKRLRLL